MTTEIYPSKPTRDSNSSQTTGERGKLSITATQELLVSLGIPKQESTLERRSKRLVILLAPVALVVGIGLSALTGAGLTPLIIIGAVLGLVGATTLIFNSTYGPVFLIFVVMTNLSDIAIDFYGLPSITKLLVPFLLLVAITRWAFFKDKPNPKWARIVIVSLVYFYVASLGLLYAREFDVVANYLDNLYKDIIIAIAIVMLLRDTQSFQRAFWALLLAGLFVGTLNAHQGLTSNFNDPYGGFAIAGIRNIVDETDDFRLGGPINAPNEFAQTMLLIIPIAFDRVIRARKPALRFIALWALGATLLTIMYTYSRGAFISAAAIFAVMMISRPTRFYAIGFTALGLVALVLFAPENYLLRLVTIDDVLQSEGGVTESSLRGRASENMAGWDMFLDNFVLGVGKGHYNIHYLDYAQNYGLDSRREERSAHNLYLEIASEMGIIGLAAFALVSGGAFWSAYRAIRIFRAVGDSNMENMARATAIALLGYLSGGMFIHDSFPRYLWMIFGLTYALHGVALQTYGKQIQTAAEITPEDVLDPVATQEIVPVNG